MKYKYLKKFNESKEGPELTFEDFKNIMADLVDEFDFEYDEFDFSEDDKYYDCWIYMPVKEGYALHDDIPYMNFDYLCDLDISHTDAPEAKSDEEFENIFDIIDYNREELERVKNDLDDIIERNKKTKQVFEILKDKIIPRFNHFSNFKECGIGFNSGELRITFDIDNE
jgi:hypothetical protein